MDKREFLRICGGSLVGAAVLPLLTNKAWAKTNAVIATGRMRGAHRGVLTLLTHDEPNRTIMAVDLGRRNPAIVRSLKIEDPKSDVWKLFIAGSETRFTVHVAGRTTIFTATMKRSRGVSTILVSGPSGESEIQTQVAPIVVAAGIGAAGAIGAAFITAAGLILVAGIQGVTAIKVARIEAENDGGASEATTEDDGFISEPICDELGLNC